MTDLVIYFSLSFTNYDSRFQPACLQHWYCSPIFFSIVHTPTALSILPSQGFWLKWGGSYRGRCLLLKWSGSSTYHRSIWELSVRTASPSLLGQVGLIKSIQSYPPKSTQILCVSDQAVTAALHYTAIISLTQGC